MRSLCVLSAAFSVCAAAQQVTTYTTDLNGRRVVDGIFSSTTIGKTTTHTEMTQSINGRMVPLESTDETVLSEDSSGRLVERLVKRYDANGNHISSEKQQIQEKKNADGSVSKVVNVYRSDLNGAFQLAERVTNDASKSGDTTNTRVTVERASIQGGLDVVERQTQVVSQDKTSSKSETTSYRKDSSGRFIPALRVVSGSEQQDSQRFENTAQYEPADDGQLRLTSQTVTRARKNADGSESREVDIFRNVPGRVESGTEVRLQERQIIEQRKSGDQIIETTVLQRPTISDPGRLGASQKISERICTGTGCK